MTGTLTVGKPELMAAVPAASFGDTGTDPVPDRAMALSGVSVVSTALLLRRWEGAPQ